MIRLSTTIVAVVFFMQVVTHATAQQMSVKSGKLITVDDRVSLVVEPRNTFNKPVKLQVRVYDHNFKLIKAKVSPREFKIRSGGTRNVRVTVPFLGETKKRFRICTERIPESNNTQQIRTRVCGRFYATRVQQ